MHTYKHLNGLDNDLKKTISAIFAIPNWALVKNIIIFKDGIISVRVIVRSSYDNQEKTSKK